MSDPFIGQITVYPYNFPPNGWLDCAGQLLPIQQFAALFSLLGTAYGGNGTSNFGLPDLQGRIPVGQGQLAGGSDYVMGEEGGSETVTLVTSNMPIHNHSLNATSGIGSTNDPTGAVLAKAQTGGGHGGSANKGNIYNPAAAATALAPTTIGNAGGSLPHNNIQPSLVLRYCICVNGVFPQRQ